MLVDLHAHYPMHLIPAGRGDAQAPLRRWRSERLRALVVDLVSRLFNYQGPGDTPSVTVPLLRAGDVGVALSVLLSPFDEIDPDEPYGAPPEARYMQSILDQMDLVEADVAGQPGARIATDRASLDAALAAGDVAIVHCLEGAFALGATPA